MSIKVKGHQLKGSKKTLVLYRIKDRGSRGIILLKMLSYSSYCHNSRPHGIQSRIMTAFALNGLADSLRKKSVSPSITRWGHKGISALWVHGPWLYGWGTMKCYDRMIIKTSFTATWNKQTDRQFYNNVDAECGLILQRALCCSTPLKFLRLPLDGAQMVKTNTASKWEDTGHATTNYITYFFK